MVKTIVCFFLVVFKNCSKTHTYTKPSVFTDQLIFNFCQVRGLVFITETQTFFCHLQALFQGLYLQAYKTNSCVKVREKIAITREKKFDNRKCSLLETFPF